ncbi:MAG TPA: D-aminoacylase [Xanthomonadales bacterium]|nr:D-aminoacylase [Xanthomonadales bacterium]
MNPICTAFTRHILAALLATLLLSGCNGDRSEQPGAESKSVGSFLITNVRIIDGSGAPAVDGAVRVYGNRILAVGAIEALEGESVFDGGGQVLAPGFIDTHSHADRNLFEMPDAPAAVGQGITTVIFGQDGGSPLPLSDFYSKLEANPAAVNVAAYSGHNTIRDAVLGKDYQRPANDAEAERMQTLLEADLEAGALGLSSGLEYDPGIYSEREEVMQLARVTAQHGGRYISHVRSEDRWFLEALEEIIAIGRETGIPVQISHIKLAMKSLWGRAPEIIAQLDQARAEGIDITADIYPYEYWQSSMYVLVPDRSPDNRTEIAFALAELAPPEGITFSRFDADPALVGQTLAAVAATRGQDPVDTFSELLRTSQAMEAESGEGADMIIAASMTEADILDLLRWPHTNVCTDGMLQDLHPRGTGSFARVLGRYVRELGALSLEEAVHKMSGLSAAHMGITDRGLIVPGMAADLVLFNPDTVLDNATMANPQAPNSGISTVWVNGQVVYENGETSGKLPGMIIRRS